MTAPGIVVVTIVHKTRRGSRKLFSYSGTRPSDGRRSWTEVTPHSHAENRAYQRALPDHLADMGPVARRRGRLRVLGPADMGAPPRPSTSRPTASRRSGGDSVHLVAGVDPSWSTLCVILDAVAGSATAAATIDLGVDDVAVVLSQLGHRIASFTALDPEVRRHAQPVLHAAIRERCMI